MDNKNSEKSIAEFEYLVLKSINVEELFFCQIELTKKFSNLLRMIEDETDRNNKIHLKSSLSLVESLLDVCKKRQEHLKANEIFFRKFHDSAKIVLSEHLYNKVLKKAVT